MIGLFIGYALPPARSRTLGCGLATGLALFLAACGSNTTLNGSGASFPASIYQRWFQDLAAQGVKVNYQSVGSGAGVRQFINRTVAFAASDVPMQPKEIAKVNQGVVQIPMTAGAIAVAYNHPGCSLKLSQAQLANIFLGKIRDFKEFGCAAQPLKVVYRSDGSGTSANFTAHLAAISPEWKSSVGVGKNVKWPIGIGAKGNEGVAAQLTQLRGAIGYAEAAYVKQPLQAAALTNASGELVPLSLESEQAGLASIDLGPNLIGRNANTVKGYPIVTFSWILLYKSGNGSRLAALQKVFGHTLSDQSQAMAPSLGFVPLPAPVLAQSRKALASIQP
jgi:phosphate transport system substrate-binding protein